MKRVTIDIDEEFAKALSITAAGADGSMIRVANVLVAPAKANYVRIDDTGYCEKKWVNGGKKDDAAD